MDSPTLETRVEIAASGLRRYYDTGWKHDQAVTLPKQRLEDAEEALAECLQELKRLRPELEQAVRDRIRARNERDELREKLRRSIALQPEGGGSTSGWPF